MNTNQPAQCTGPDPDTRKPSYKMPAGATDCHAHVFGTREKYGWADDRLYTPPPVFLKDYLAMLDALGLTRGVMVQSGVHGTNNDVIVDSIAQSNGRLKGIALIAENIADAELDRLNAAGVCGFRANLVAKTGVQFEASRRLAARVARLGWHAQFLLDIESFPHLDRVLADFPVDVMIDHMGRPDTRGGPGAPGFQALIRFLKAGRGWSKLSAPYRTSREAPLYADIAKFAHALVEAAPDRLVWGTDWPHVMLETAMPNTGVFADLLAAWVPDEAVRKRILVDNPAKRYGFAQA